MALKAIHESLDEISEPFRELYSERDGKFELTGIEGIKTDADVARVQEALNKERTDHKTAKTSLQVWGDLKHDQVLKDQDELVELRARVETLKSGKEDPEAEAKREKEIEARVATKTAPLTRDLEKIQAEQVVSLEAITAYENKDRIRTINDAVRLAAVESKVIGHAMEDVTMLAERVFEVGDEGQVVTRDNVGVTPGIAPDIWLTEMQEKRPHWWPTAQGGGANGGSAGGGFADNPWSSEHWNLTAQGQAVRTDASKAERMAKAVGSKVGAVHPPIKATDQAARI